MSNEVRYISGMMRRVGRSYRHSWMNHIGVVDHVYGPHGEHAYVRTLCGRVGVIRVTNRGINVVRQSVECKVCVKAWDKMEAAA